MSLKPFAASAIRFFLIIWGLFVGMSQSRFLPPSHLSLNICWVWVLIPQFGNAVEYKERTHYSCPIRFIFILIPSHRHCMLQLCNMSVIWSFSTRFWFFENYLINFDFQSDGWNEASLFSVVWFSAFLYLCHWELLFSKPFKVNRSLGCGQ